MIPWTSGPSPSVNFVSRPSAMPNSAYGSAVPNQMYYVVLPDGTTLAPQCLPQNIASSQPNFPLQQPSPIMFFVNGGSQQGMFVNAPNAAFNMGVPIASSNIAQPNVLMANSAMQNGSLNLPRQDFTAQSNVLTHFPNYSNLSPDNAHYQQQSFSNGPGNVSILDHGKATAANTRIPIPAISAVPRHNKVKKDSGLGLTCFYCNGVGHKAIHCPKNPDWSGELSALCVVHNKTRCMSSLKRDEDGNYSCIQQSACRRVTNPAKSVSQEITGPTEPRLHWAELKTTDPLEVSLCDQQNFVIHADHNVQQDVACSSNLLAPRQGDDRKSSTTSSTNHVDDSLIELMRSLCIPSSKNDSTTDNINLAPQAECFKAPLHLGKSLNMSAGIMPSQVTMETGSMLHLSGLSLDLNN